MENTSRPATSRPLLLVGLALLVGMTSCVTRSCGVHPVHECHPQTLSPQEVQAMYQLGVDVTDEGMMGEYRLTSSLERGLPILKRAALHGHRRAMEAYASHFITAGIVEMTSLMWLSQLDTAAEGLMWHLLLVHLSGETPEGEEAVYRVLLDPSVPFPDDYFDHVTGSMTWMFQMLTPWGVDWARQQAYALRDCWTP